MRFTGFSNNTGDIVFKVVRRLLTGDCDKQEMDAGMSTVVIDFSSFSESSEIQVRKSSLAVSVLTLLNPSDTKAGQTRQNFHFIIRTIYLFRSINNARSFVWSRIRRPGRPPSQVPRRLTPVGHPRARCWFTMTSPSDRRLEVPNSATSSTRPNLKKTLSQRLPPPSLFQGPPSRNASHISLALPSAPPSDLHAPSQPRASRIPPASSFVGPLPRHIGR